jgi:thymidylate kinase
MFTVAVIGPDGAGKSAVTRRLQKSLPLPVKYIYMGVNLESSNLVLPTTRIILELKRWGGGRPDMTGPPDPTRVKIAPQNNFKRLVKDVKMNLRLANLMAEEWYRQIVVRNYLRHGYIVISDRHFFCDYYAHDIAVDRSQLPLARRVHGVILDRYYPRPDLLICLDAPGDVLFARKGEGTPAMLEARRQEYLQLRDAVPHYVLVDATKSLDAVTQETSEIIVEFHANQIGGKGIQTSPPTLEDSK